MLYIYEINSNTQISIIITKLVVNQGVTILGYITVGSSSSADVGECFIKLKVSTRLQSNILYIITMLIHLYIRNGTAHLYSIFTSIYIVIDNPGTLKTDIKSITV